MTAKQELVVPKSIPITAPLTSPDLKMVESLFYIGIWIEWTDKAAGNKLR